MVTLLAMDLCLVMSVQAKSIETAKIKPLNSSADSKVSNEWEMLAIYSARTDNQRQINMMSGKQRKRNYRKYQKLF
jgi:hypothetical protein